jgi:NAD(P)-dependent dehydrogenase (short-subunit alcohol dehydrogenase family)
VDRNTPVPTQSVRGLRALTAPLGGRSALVIGGGSGIGLACARMLAADGARVTIAGRTAAKLLDAAASLDDEGLHVETVPTDALEAPDVARAVEQASINGRLDAAVVVPGGGSISPVLLFDDDQFSDEVDRNVRPVFLTLKYAGQAMVRNGSGSFVAISSTAADFSARYLASYSAGKAAVDQLVRVAADELGPLGIRVNGVRPGLTRTAATEGAFSNNRMLQAFLDSQPIRRPGEATDVAHAVRYLIGPESAWMTGQLLTVDGGHTLRAFVDYAQLLDLPDVRAAVEATTPSGGGRGRDGEPRAS